MPDWTGQDPASAPVILQQGGGTQTSRPAEPEDPALRPSPPENVNIREAANPPKGDFNPARGNGKPNTVPFLCNII